MARFVGAVFCGMLLTSNPAWALQTVYLDFVNDFDVGEHVYTALEQTAIRDNVAADYADFSFSFTLTEPSAGLYSTLVFNADGISGGLADAIDFRNLNPADNARININAFLGGSLPATSANFIAMTSGVASHELGHIVGLRHHDSMGPIGSGIGVVPGGAALLPTYLGPTGADETFGHVMASPAAVGQPLSALIGDTFLSERSSIKVAFSETGSISAEQAATHSSFATAQPLALSPLDVPNTLLSGVHAGLFFNVDTLAVTGELDSSGQIDIYSFNGKKDDLFNFEIISNVLSYYANPIDPEIRIFDSNGNFVPYFGTDAYNDDEFETQDSILVDLVLPQDDTYYVKINAFNAADQGNYDLFGYRYAAVPEPGTASLLGLGLMALGLRRCRNRTRSRLS